MDREALKSDLRKLRASIEMIAGSPPELARELLRQKGDLSKKLVKLWKETYHHATQKFNQLKHR